MEPAEPTAPAKPREPAEAQQGPAAQDFTASSASVAEPAPPCEGRLTASDGEEAQNGRGTECCGRGVVMGPCGREYCNHFAIDSYTGS